MLKERQRLRAFSSVHSVTRGDADKSASYESGDKSHALQTEAGPLNKISM